MDGQPLVEAFRRLPGCDFGPSSRADEFYVVACVDSESRVVGGVFKPVDVGAGAHVVVIMREERVAPDGFTYEFIHRLHDCRHASECVPSEVLVHGRPFTLHIVIDGKLGQCRDPFRPEEGLGDTFCVLIYDAFGKAEAVFQPETVAEDKAPCHRAACVLGLDPFLSGEKRRQRVN